MSIHQLAVAQVEKPAQSLSACEHRTVSKEGRIVCGKIVEGENEVTPNTCRTCPFKAVNCVHLRFSLHQTTPSPLIVRYNGRTEIWDDEPPQLLFHKAACATKVTPVDHPRVCAGCALRQPLQAAAAPAGCRRRPAAARAGGKVVAFRGREAAAAAG